MGSLSVTDGTFLRVFTFEPSYPGEIDSTLRDHVLRALCDQSGILEAYTARQGPGETGDRIIATVWESKEAMEAGAIEADVIARRHAEYADGIPGSRVASMPVAVRLSFGRADPGRILRVLRGQVRDAGLETYVDDVRAGAGRDGTGGGLLALCLGVVSADEFVTVSTWTSWEAIETATGGNLQRPIATRFPERIRILSARHYEILPDTPRPVASTVAPGTTSG